MRFCRSTGATVARCSLWAATLSLVCFATLVLAHPTSAGCFAQQYKVVAVPIQPRAINDLGQVAGTTANHRAALWSAQAGLHELALPAGFSSSEAVAINNDGHVAVIAYDRTFSKHQAFIFENGVLKLLMGQQTRAFHIDESDRVAGDSLLPGAQRTEPVLWIHHAMRSLGSCCGGSTKSVNQNGEAIGDAYDDQGRYYAFLWTAARGMQRIGPADRFSSAVAINARGHVVIQVFPGVLFYSDGSLTPLDMSPKFPSQPRAINDCDVIVGAFGPFSDADRAFVWSKSIGFQDLNERIPADSDWKLESAVAINNRGEIVGKGDWKRQDDSGFLLIPE